MRLKLDIDLLRVPADLRTMPSVANVLHHLADVVGGFTPLDPNGEDIHQSIRAHGVRVGTLTISPL